MHIKDQTCRVACLDSTMRYAMWINAGTRRNFLKRVFFQIPTRHAAKKDAVWVAHVLSIIRLRPFTFFRRSDFYNFTFHYLRRLHYLRYCTSLRHPLAIHITRVYLSQLYISPLIFTASAIHYFIAKIPRSLTPGLWLKVRAINRGDFDLFFSRFTAK